MASNWCGVPLAASLVCMLLLVVASHSASGSEAVASADRPAASLAHFTDDEYGQAPVFDYPQAYMERHARRPYRRAFAGPIIGPRCASGAVQTGARWLSLHEYQSKSLLRSRGLTVQDFFVAATADECAHKLRGFRQHEYVVKAQILAGGRGKGTFDSGLHGGVHITPDAKRVVQYAREMLGYRLITKQTPPDGSPVNKVMVCESISIERETYLAILLDREHGAPVVIASAAGGVDIEEVAEQTPHLIHTEVVDIDTGLTGDQIRRLVESLGFDRNLYSAAGDQIRKLYQTFVSVDATQIEINPFVETDDGRVFCVDAKLQFDDNAAFRQKQIFALEDRSEGDPSEVRAERLGLNYIRLDGNIACLVNGAGLAMATMDIIKHHGMAPANFLDVGGRVDADRVLRAIEIISADPGVESILVNIFGGIVNCKLIAEGLVSAFGKQAPRVPLVVRLEGTQADAARRLLRDSKLPIIAARDLDDAATKAVAAATQARDERQSCAARC